MNRTVSDFFNRWFSPRDCRPGEGNCFACKLCVISLFFRSRASGDVRTECQLILSWTNLEPLSAPICMGSVLFVLLTVSAMEEKNRSPTRSCAERDGNGLFVRPLFFPGNVEGRGISSCIYGTASFRLCLTMTSISSAAFSKLSPAVLGRDDVVQGEKGRDPFAALNSFRFKEYCNCMMFKPLD